MRKVSLLLSLTFLVPFVPAQAPRLIRSLSGPSGVVDGAKFVFDETRMRFVYPQDKSLTVYFEWESVPGPHSLNAVWKDPSGKAVTLSPEVKVNAPTKELNCYWIFHLIPGLVNGVWTVEVRVDGQPAGSHSFELVGF